MKVNLFFKIFLFSLVVITLSLIGCSEPVIYDQTWGNVHNQTHPDGAIHSNERIYQRGDIRNKFNHWVLWFQTATDTTQPQTHRSGIAIFGIRIKENGKSIMSWDDKDNGNPFEGGGLFSRFPRWFKTDAHYNMNMGRMIKLIPNRNPILIATYEHPKYVVHWWTKRFKYNRNSQYQIEIDYSCIGASMQVGIDLWKGTGTKHNGWNEKCEGVNNCEMYVSPWLLPDGEPHKIKTLQIHWQPDTVSINYPK